MTSVKQQVGFTVWKDISKIEEALEKVDKCSFWTSNDVCTYFRIDVIYETAC